MSVLSAEGRSGIGDDEPLRVISRRSIQPAFEPSQRHQRFEVAPKSVDRGIHPTRSLRD